MNLKAFLEKRNQKVAQMEELATKVETEVRAFTAEENTEYEKLQEEVRALDATIAKLESKQEERKFEEKKEEAATNEKELRSIFAGEKRASMNTGTGAEGGVVVNEELSQEIIKTLKDRSNVLGFFNTSTVKGTAKFPKKATSGTASWEDEMVNPDGTPKATIPTLSTIELGQHRLYRESAITQQMLNSEELNLEEFVKDDIAESMQDAVEISVFIGDGTKKPTGLVSGIQASKKVTVTTRGEITFDLLKKLKAKVKKAGRKGAKFFMHPDTLLALSLVKDSMGQYILNDDVTKEDGSILLGFPVEETDAMPSINDTGANCLIIFAAPSAYHVNIQKQVSLNIYNDSAYNRAGLVGYGSDIYLDGKVKNDDVLAGLFNKTS